MFDSFWDFFVDSLRLLFTPLLCSYFTLTSDLFLNLSTRDAKGLEWVGDTLLSPTQYLLGGREAILGPDGSWKFVQKYNYKQIYWFKTAVSVAALPTSITLGTAVKAMSFLNKETRDRYVSIKKAWQSTTVSSNAESYQERGIELRPSEKAEWFLSENHLRRPGDEKLLAPEKEGLKQIISRLNSVNIPWWVDCGTCLGAYRYGGVIPWDDDLDIAILLDDFENVRKILNDLDPKKYMVQDWSTRDFPQSFIKVYVRESGKMIDIYSYAISPKDRELEYVFSLDSHTFFPEWFKIRERRFTRPVSFDTVFPLKKVMFDGMEVFIPSDPKKYLQRCYGENLAPVKIYDSMTGRYEKDLTHPYWKQEYVH